MEQRHYAVKRYAVIRDAGPSVEYVTRFELVAVVVTLGEAQDWLKHKGPGTKTYYIARLENVVRYSPRTVWETEAIG